MLRPYMPEWLKSEPIEFTLECVAAIALVIVFVWSVVA